MSMYPIATNIVTSASTYSCAFTSIPQNFTHLQLRVFSRGTQATATNYQLLQFNSDSANYNYRGHWLIGDGSSASSSGDSSTSTYITLNYAPGNTSTANVYGSYIIDILDYTSTVKNKTVRSIGGYDANGSGSVSLYSGFWFISPIAAINTLSLFMSNAAVGTRVDLYGVSTSNATGA
jgi:hypothetical protein